MADQTDEFADRRREMVSVQIMARGIRNPRVLEAMRRIPRHLFVPPELSLRSYDDEPLPIGGGQTISQPYIVAYMTEALDLGGGEKVLEIGTGSGYQTAVLAELAREVYTVELLPDLADRSRTLLTRLGCDNVRFRTGDGTLGWPDHAPYDAIMVTAAAAAVPAPLESQLGEAGRMILPVGGPGFQELVLVRREGGAFRREKLLSVRFVPLVSTH